MNDILRILQTIRPGETKRIVAPIDAIETVWFNQISRKDVRDFEIVIIELPWHCEVSIRPYTGSLSKSEWCWLIGTTIVGTGVIWLIS